MYVQYRHSRNEAKATRSYYDGPWCIYIVFLISDSHTNFHRLSLFLGGEIVKESIKYHNEN